MRQIDTTDIRELRADEVNAVTGGELSVRPLGTEQLFWDPMWWEVGQTGTLPRPTIRLR